MLSRTLSKIDGLGWAHSLGFDMAGFDYSEQRYYGVTSEMLSAHCRIPAQLNPVSRVTVKLLPI